MNTFLCRQKSQAIPTRFFRLTGEIEDESEAIRGSIICASILNGGF